MLENDADDNKCNDADDNGNDVEKYPDDSV